jgi:hypothetical protein
VLTVSFVVSAMRECYIDGPDLESRFRFRVSHRVTVQVQARVHLNPEPKPNRFASRLQRRSTECCVYQVVNVIVRKAGPGHTYPHVHRPHMPGGAILSDLGAEEET